jgi:predicted nucleic acid-binding protein
MRISLEAQAKMYIQCLIITNELELVCSYMSMYENNDNPHEEQQDSITDFFQNASEFIDYDRAEQVEARAARIMEYGIKNKDAIHLSCAVEAGCDYFITTDDGILRKYKGAEIQVCSPVDFVKYVEEDDA